jgi:hypothetical protein
MKDRNQKNGSLHLFLYSSFNPQGPRSVEQMAKEIIQYF